MDPTAFYSTNTQGGTSLPCLPDIDESNNSEPEWYRWYRWWSYLTLPLQGMCCGYQNLILIQMIILHRIVHQTPQCLFQAHLQPAPTLISWRNVPQFTWVKQHITASPENTHLFAHDENNPLEYFRRYFHSNVINKLINKSNFYSLQQTTSINTNTNKIEVLRGSTSYALLCCQQ